MTLKIQMKIFFTLLILEIHNIYSKESSQNLNDFDKNSFSMLHLSIRNLQKLWYPFPSVNDA